MINELKTATIILNYNKYELTRRLVKNFKEIGYQGYIVVVDNNSNNDSFNILYNELNSIENKIHVIKSDKNGGYAYGNNIGIKYIIAKYSDIKYICISNPDVILDKNFSMEKNIEIIKNKDEIAGVAPIQILNGRQMYGWELGDLKSILIGNMSVTSLFRKKLKTNKATDVEALPGSFFIMKRDVFENINFFDEKTFLYFEESIIAIKLKNLGYKLVVNLEDYYIHDHQDKDKEYKI